ncbi:MAG: DUF3459 domain-containing protein [Pseudomonadota bacterium]|nr:DUF3459 domain-containing protein [Pseudomonadota bacterium]
MPWTAEGPSAGFSTSDRPWLPVRPEHRTLNAAVQEKDPESCLNFVRNLLKLRQAHPALKQGTCELIPTDNDIVAFRRTLDGETLLCVFSFSRDRTLDMPVSGSLTPLLSRGCILEKDRIRLDPLGFSILEVT